MAILRTRSELEPIDAPPTLAFRIDNLTASVEGIRADLTGRLDAVIARVEKLEANAPKYELPRFEVGDQVCFDGKRMEVVHPYRLMGRWSYRLVCKSENTYYCVHDSAISPWNTKQP